MNHKDVCHKNCPDPPTRVDLTRNHGTPREFAEAVRNAWDFVTPNEAIDAITRYESEWSQALEK